MKLPIDPNSVKGFLASDEGEYLYQCALDVAHLGPGVEIGSYCGKSTLYLGKAFQEKSSILFAVDHHRGSEEHQLGEEYHDAALFDSARKCMNSFDAFRETMVLASLENTVVPVVTDSVTFARGFSGGISLLFIDGGHSDKAAMDDYVSWVRFLLPGGILMIHDVFEDPSEGGMAPATIYQYACESGVFKKLSKVNTLTALQRK